MTIRLHINNLPFGTKILVTNADNDKSSVVRINDRGPFVSDHIIDLSPAAAKKLDFYNHIVANVHLEALHPKVKITGDLVESNIPKRASLIMYSYLGLKLKNSYFKNVPNILFKTPR